MTSLNNKSNITALQFYSYKLSIRDGFNPFFNLGKLTQQYIVDAWIKVESSRLYYLKEQQQILRTKLYKGLMHHLEKKIAENKNVEKIGKMIILPSSFTESPRVLHKNFIDAMVLVQKFGKRDLFITMTCNALWEEIVNNIGVNEKAIDRLDIVVKVFNQKVKELKMKL